MTSHQLTAESPRPLDMHICRDRTFTIHRGLRMLAGVVVVTSVLLGMFVHPNWLYLTLFAGLNLFQSSLTNWCPAVPLLRKSGCR